MINVVDFVIVIWAFVGVLCVYYLTRNVARSWKRRQYEQQVRPVGDPARYLAERRLEQECVLLAVGVVLAVAGVSTNFVSSPALDSWDGWIRFGIRGSLAAAQVGLVMHSHMIHANHHRALNILSSWQLRQQLAQKRDRNVVENTAATLANTIAMKANTLSHEAALLADTIATEANTVATDANTAATEASTSPRDTEDE